MRKVTRRKHVSITACLLSLWIIQGCRQQPSLQPVNAQEPAVSANPDTNQLISSALKALKVSGIPEPPLSPKSTRTQRQEFLLATEEALSDLRKLPSAPAARVVISPSLLPPGSSSAEI